MTRISARVAAELLVFAALSYAQTPLYRQVDKFSLGGEGGWDYITYEPDGNRLFIGHNSAIYVVDAATGKKLGEVPASGAHGAALVPDKGMGFSSNGRAGTVTAFDLKTLAPKAYIKVGENPDAIIYDKYSKKVLVMNGRSGELMAIDPVSLKVTATVPLGGKLEFAATDNGHIYVNIENTGEVAVVDFRNWKATQRWKLNGCEEPSGLAIDERAGRLFSVCANRIMKIETSTGRTVATLPTGNGTDGVAFDPATRLAFASDGEGTMTIVRETTDGHYEVVGNIDTQRGARTVTLDSRRHRVYLPAAFGPPLQGQKRPSIKPGSFVILVYAPAP